jgi:hypothetical protein
LGKCHESAGVASKKTKARSASLPLEKNFVCLAQFLAVCKLLPVMGFPAMFIAITKYVQSNCHRHLTRKEGKAEQLSAISQGETMQKQRIGRRIITE